VRTTREGTHPGRRALKWVVASVAVSAACVFAGLGLAASSFSDTPGDANEAPDVVSVTVSTAAEGVVNVGVAIDNFESLPANSWINLWFDLDSDSTTGDEGDEALILYSADGGLEHFRWNGAQLVAQPVTGMTATYTAGVLSVAAPASALDNASAFGILAVASSGQTFGSTELIASDYAPDSGRSAYVGPASTDFPDPGHDHDSAPDLTSIDVTDARNGWIRFAISTPNYAQLPVDAVLVLLIDRDNRTSTGVEGSDVTITTVGGEFVLERWDPRKKSWVGDERPTRVRVGNSGNVVTIDVHRSELQNAPRFGFALVAADIDTQSETILGVDVAPDRATFYRYRLSNEPALVLTATRLFAAPAKPQAGKPFTVNLAVTRSDTSRGITSAAVTCNVSAGGKKLPARGTVSRGAGHCAVIVPPTAAGSALRGTITVRTGGKSVSRAFAYVVR
jgi:hypothetical protein